MWTSPQAPPRHCAGPLHEGQLHECPVTAVLCWGYLDQHRGTPDGPFEPAYSAVDARAAVDAIVDRVLGEAAAAIDRSTVNDVPARGLVESSEDADLLVVGARGLGTLRDLLLGSVSQACLHRARIPMAVVRTTSAQRSTRTRTGGRRGDGSETAQRALTWALDEARRRQAAIEVVHAWTPPLLAVPTLVRLRAVRRGRPFHPRRGAGKGGTSNLPVPVRRTIRTGSGGRVLVEQAKGADLVVVGCTGLGGFTGCCSDPSATRSPTTRRAPSSSSPTNEEG